MGLFKGYMGFRAKGLLTMEPVLSFLLVVLVLVWSSVQVLVLLLILNILPDLIIP